MWSSLPGRRTASSRAAATVAVAVPRPATTATSGSRSVITIATSRKAPTPQATPTVLHQVRWRRRTGSSVVVGPSSVASPLAADPDRWTGSGDEATGGMVA